MQMGPQSPAKPVRISDHAKGYQKHRGFTFAEVEGAIRASPWSPAEAGRLECRRDYPFGALWNGLFYNTKQVRPIFVELEREILVVTVYTYYF